MCCTIISLIILAFSVHILPEVAAYDLARDAATVLNRFIALISISHVRERNTMIPYIVIVPFRQCGMQMGFNLARCGWTPKLVRLYKYINDNCVTWWTLLYITLYRQECKVDTQ